MLHGIIFNDGVFNAMYFCGNTLHGFLRQMYSVIPLQQIASLEVLREDVHYNKFQRSSVTSPLKLS